MAYFIPKYQKINQKWYPRSITVGKPVTTDMVADKLAEESTLTRGDIYAVLKNLGKVIATYMADGRSVKLSGVGTFYYTSLARGNGVDTAEEVNAKQIVGTRVRFIPETTRTESGTVSTRSLITSENFWRALTTSDSDGTGTDTDSDSDNETSGGTSGSDSGNTGTDEEYPIE